MLQTLLGPSPMANHATIVTRFLLSRVLNGITITDFSLNRVIMAISKTLIYFGCAQSVHSMFFQLR